MNLALDPAVDPAFDIHGLFGVSAAQRLWSDLARKADSFPHHGRQAMPENSAPQALHLDIPVPWDAVWWVTTALLAILIAVYVLHRHIRSHHLRSRVHYDFLPTTTFDPTQQAVLNFAHQLGRVRPVHGWVPKSVVGVRIRFATEPDYGKMIMSVEGRKSVSGVINKLAYPQVEGRLRPPAPR
ncbi:hypothetical protein [Amycolatopsis magusensis]|uniref:hypothetical protein n=1 Tax=Amycolatopsis magusensis TaxID=882444 RepID=UPI0024A9229C|nr:hypothetical protein [Amycolatopsis magusensis]MDI5975487.1 hypothetical protein [Amycolatopsis magusensis]